jgi:YidC/Oxa1 family membrane protein insertase
MDRTSIIALVFCVLGYFGWAQYMKEKYPPRPAAPAAALVDKEHALHSAAAELKPIAADKSHAAAEESSAQAALDYPQLSTDELTISTDKATYRFNQQHGGIDSIVLKDYRNDEGTAPMELVAHPPMLLQAITAESQAKGLRGFRALRSEGSISFGRQDGPWQLEHSITPDAHGYGASVRMSWKNTSAHAAELTSTALMSNTIGYKQKSSSFLPGSPSGRPMIIREIANDTAWQDLQEYCEGGKEAKSPVIGAMQELDFLGIDQHYFLQVLIPQHKKTSFRALSTASTPTISCTVAEMVSLNQGTVAPGQVVVMEFKAWFGPKVTELAGAYDSRLANSLDLGFFAAISRPLLAALKAVNSLVVNWGLAIIIFTIVLKLLFYPLTRQAAVAQQKMKKLQPEINALKERYKDDPRRQQQEMMKFMSVNKANPLKGCLPILPQIPVFFAFFRVLSSSIELRHAPFYGWISDLSVQDPYFITPLLLGFCMFLQQKLSPAPGMDKTQERIMLLMPLMFTVMMLTLPAGLVLYMLTNTLISIAQQQWLNKRLVLVKI